MKAPKCKICGKEHYGICDYHRVDGEVERPASVGEAKADSRAKAQHKREVHPTSLPNKGRTDARTGDGANPNAEQRASVASVQPEKFDRVAYQREYMRKRRAAMKARNERP